MSELTLAARLGDEADLCRNDGACDIAGLLDEAAAALDAAHKLLTKICRHSFLSPASEAEILDAISKIEGVQK